MTEPVWLVVGLGNPGPSYAGNRHNIGYLVNDELASRVGGTFKSHKTGRADVVEGRLGGPGGVRVVLARPRCYMNETGGPVSALAKFYKVPVVRIVAVHDELDIPFDTLRIKVGDQILAKDLSVPAGSTILLDEDALVINVTHAPTAEEVEEELAEAEAEVGIERVEAEEETEAAEAAEGAEGESAEGEEKSEGE
jgi:hypothetical protein